jgi:hypothetical protein
VSSARDSIKLIASSESGFKSLLDIRNRLPEICCEQIESIGFGFNSKSLHYRQAFGGEVYVPIHHPISLSSSDGMIRVFGEATVDGHNTWAEIPYSVNQPTVRFIPMRAPEEAIQ